MIGGPGWTREHVHWFLNGDFFITPCGAVPKNGDPFGRIVHNYSHEFDGLSLNTALLDNSVSYISFKERVLLLSQVTWYFKVDLKNGYRQVPVSPKDWHTQVYSLGPNEFYIDLAMPFGKANSSKLFCSWTDLWFSSFHYHFKRSAPFRSVIGSYVDDGFGGAMSQEQTQLMIDTLLAVGRQTASFFNTDKTRGPARSLVVLGLLFCSISKSCRLGRDKRQKYLSRVSALLAAPTTSSKALEQLVGNLGYAAWVEPFCRPLLSCLSLHIVRDEPSAPVPLTPLMVIALHVWRLVLVRNRGLHFNFILGRLPQVASPIFVDASSSWGFGGVHGYEFFSFPHTELRPFIRRCPGWETFPCVPVARLELLAVFVAVRLYARRYPNHMLVLYSDNSNVVAWLGNRRSPNPAVCSLVAAIECLKYRYTLKVSVRYIPTHKNRSADQLSRNKSPRWLRNAGSETPLCMRKLARAIDLNNLISSWTTAVNH